jgi:hypothetical protein
MDDLKVSFNIREQVFLDAETLLTAPPNGPKLTGCPKPHQVSVIGSWYVDLIWHLT